MQLDQITNKIGEIVVKALRIQYNLQGHKLTGNLSNSIEFDVIKSAARVQIDFLMLDYGLIVNSGVIASRIPYNPGSGAKTSKYITALTNYAKARFFVGQQEAQRIAFAIARKHKKEGMPTKSSAQFSKTGRRTGAIDEALQDVDNEVQELIGLAIEELINQTFLKAS